MKPFPQILQLLGIFNYQQVSLSCFYCKAIIIGLDCDQ